MSAPAIDDRDVTVLLVDDTPANLTAMAAVLEPLGYRLLAAGSGDEALRYLLTEDVSLILLDVRMPGMSGIETASRIRQRERTRNIPVMFLTAYDDTESLVAQGFSAGAVDWVIKPVDPVLLRSKVRVLIDLHQRSEALRAEREALAKQLDEQYAAETRTLRSLADAALAINSTQALSEMLRAINEAAAEVTCARHAEAILEGGPGPSHRAVLYDLALRAGPHPPRLTAKEVEAVLAAHDALDSAGGDPVLAGWLAVPLVGRTGRALGIIQVADKIEGDFTESDEVVLLQLAQLAAVAIENAERFEIEHTVAQDLQRVLLPGSLPVVGRLATAARYRPGGRGTQVGGDWYDVVPLVDGRAVLTIGDVMGRGARAAAVMGQLRTALHAYALQDLRPGVAMRSVDMLLHDLSDGAMATAIYLVLDPQSGRFEMVSAGHPPPLVVSPEGAVAFLSLDPHTPLGVVDGSIYTASVETLLEGSTLLLYTDGLIEDRETGLQEGLAKLGAQMSVAVGTSSASLDELCDAIITEMVPAGRDDDVAMLAVRIGDQR